ncbi:MAG: iron uptake porin [Cyanophyceae cyanobacterium]
MSSLFWNSLKLGSLAFGVSLLMAPEAKANDSLDLLSRADFVDDTALEQVTSVSQLSDVQPTDWAFQALQSLVERYGCIAGYPDGTFRGNRALTRYEFAAGLNACLAKVEELIGTATGDLATKADLQTLQRLQEEFAAELAVLRGRVDALEARTSELEANQFSTTTKLNGEVLFNFAGANNPEFDGSDTDDNQITFSHRVRLNFDSSFNGRDRLRVRLQTGNTPRYFGDETSMARFGFEARDGNTFVLDKMFYRFPVASGLTGYVGPLYNLDDIHDPLNPYFVSSGGGAVSRFARRDPFIYRGPAGAGLGLSYKAGRFGAALSYFGGNDAPSPDLGDGFFNGTMNATLTANYKITDSWTVGAAYSYRYFSSGDNDLGGGTASGFGRRPFGSVNPTNSHNVGIQTIAQISDGFAIGGWASVAMAEDTRSDREAKLFNWAVHLAFPDLFKEGNLGGIIVGQPPYVYDGDGVADEENPSWHIEALYRIKVNDNIDITPAAFVVTNPENNDGNDAAVVGVIRTRFQF